MRRCPGPTHWPPISRLTPPALPAFVRPPTLSWASITVTRAPAASSFVAAVSPASPAPTITTSTATLGDHGPPLILAPPSHTYLTSPRLLVRKIPYRVSRALVATEAFGQGLAGRRLPGPLGLVVHPGEAALHVPGAQPPQGFRFPGARRVVDGRKAGNGGVPAEDQGGHRPAGEGGGGPALPRVNAGGGGAL